MSPDNEGGVVRNKSAVDENPWIHIEFELPVGEDCDGRGPKKVVGKDFDDA